MKKLILLPAILLFLVGFGVAQEQAIITWEGLQKSKIKSDKNIEHPKKKLKYKTWAKRGKLYYDIHTFNTGMLYIGMPMKNGREGDRFVVGAESVVGKPTNEINVGKEIKWEYPRKNLYFDESGHLAHWEETQFIDKDAIVKSAKAYLKADELDTKKKFRKKTTTKTEIMLVRSALVNKGIEYYENGDFKNAYPYLDLASALADFPKLKSDTTFNAGVGHYYSAIIAFKAGDYDNATKHFNECINRKYEEGICCHYIADALAKKGDSVAYVNKVKEGFDKYPNTEQLIIDLINYYISKKQPEKVIEYIDIAISKNPTNPSYYSAKAEVYNKENEKLFKEYEALKNKQHSKKKEAFRFRNNPTKKAQSEKEMKEFAEQAKKIMTKIEDLYAKSFSLYDESLKQKPGFFNSLFSKGMLNYERYERKRWESEFVVKLAKSQMEGFKISDKLKAEGEEFLKKSAQNLEEAHKADPNDRGTIKNLKIIYRKLKSSSKGADKAKYKAKFEEYETKLAKLGNENNAIK